MPKVIRTDNFAREDKCPQIIAEGLTPEAAQALCEEKRKGCTPYGSDWYEVKPDGYWIEKFEDYPGFIEHDELEEG